MRTVFLIRLTAIAFAFCLTLPLTAYAATQQVWTFAIDSATEFKQQAAELREAMDDGRYASITKKDRQAVEADLAYLSDLVSSGRKSPENLSAANAEKRINTVLSRHDGDRVICKRERKIGTNFKTKSCFTARQWEQMRSESANPFQDDPMGGSSAQ